MEPFDIFGERPEPLILRAKRKYSDLPEKLFRELTEQEKEERARKPRTQPVAEALHAKRPVRRWGPLPPSEGGAIPGEGEGGGLHYSGDGRLGMHQRAAFCVVAEHR